MQIVQGFFAYQSYPPDSNEVIEIAIDNINASKLVYIKSWKELTVTGNFIINSILSEIENCQLFICDLTYLNFNVLFELGYAIAKNKKIWVLLNDNIGDSVKEFKKLGILNTIGYSSCANSKAIIEKIYKEQPYDNLDKTILSQVRKGITSSKKLLYLKSLVDTEASTQLSVIINDSMLPSLVDNPSEVKTQPLEWYINNLYNSYGIVIHLLGENITNYKILNAKNSLIAGLALGFRIPLLLLAHDPFNPPIDYKDILHIHDTANQCTKIVKEWLEPIEKEYKDNKTSYISYLKGSKALSELQNLFIGEPIAEHEREQLVDYFLQTREYLEALNSQQTLFIGRKGTGKTANLLKIENELLKDRRNYVCVVQPVQYEIEGVLNMLRQSISKSEKGYLVESIWKFLIYTELAKSLYSKLNNRPQYITYSKEEKELIQFVDSNERFINADFTLRLENAVNSLCGLSECTSIESQRIKVSEILHDTMISKLRLILGNVLQDKNKVCIIIDNLDASWNQKDNLEELCSLLFGLLNVINKVSDEFHKSDYNYKKVNLSLITFLRSDIFNQILAYANERDKIQHSKLIWEDTELLFRLIENRFKYNIDTPSPRDFWGKFFCEKVYGVPLKKYISDLIITRPRDIIILFRAAIQEADIKGHARVEESDFLSAEKKYSQYALDSLLAENGNRVDDLESIIYEFVGGNSILTKIEIEALLNELEVKNTAEVIDLLCELTFFELETDINKFEPIHENRNKRILYKLAERTVQNRVDKMQRIKIHNAFHAHLGIRKNNSSE